MASRPITSCQIYGEKEETDRFYFLGLQKSLWMVIAAMKLKDTCSWEEKLCKPKQCIKKAKTSLCQQRSILSKLFLFISNHIQMRELDHKEG